MITGYGYYCTPVKVRVWLTGIHAPPEHLKPIIENLEKNQGKLCQLAQIEAAMDPWIQTMVLRTIASKKRIEAKRMAIECTTMGRKVWLHDVRMPEPHHKALKAQAKAIGITKCEYVSLLLTRLVETSVGRNIRVTVGRGKLHDKIDLWINDSRRFSAEQGDELTLDEMRKGLL